MALCSIICFVIGSLYLFRYRQSVLYTATWQKESVAGSLFFHKVTAKIGGTVRFIAIAIILM